MEHDQYRLHMPGLLWVSEHLALMAALITASAAFETSFARMFPARLSRATFGRCWIESRQKPLLLRASISAVAEAFERNRKYPPSAAGNE
jgi:hypothetical protein